MKHQVHRREEPDHHAYSCETVPGRGSPDEIAGLVAMNEVLSRWVTQALTETLFGPSRDPAAEEIVDRYFSPEFTDTIDGVTLDRVQFGKHVASLRSTLAGGRIEPLDAVREGRSIAHRHLVEMTTTDATTRRLEVYMFGELADDGRILSLVEATRELDPTEQPSS